jgi:hypothetical protein
MTSFITVRLLTGEVFQVDVFPGITVMQVKELIHDSKGISPLQMRLIYAGKQLHNSRILNNHEVDFTLSDYDVPMEGAEVHLVLMLR